MKRSGLPLLLTLVLAACGGPPPPAVAPALRLETLEIASEEVRRLSLQDGVVAAVDRATVSAQTAGRVVELPYDVDDVVEAGAVIVRFTDVEQQSGRRQAEAALKAAEAAAKEAALAFQRSQEMLDRKLIATSAHDQARARRDAANAALEAARAALRSAGEQVDYTVVRAPYSGILTERHVQVGETVRPGQPLLSGLSLARLRVDVEVPQGDIAAIRAERSAEIVLPDGRRIPARKLILFPEGDPRTHSFRVRLELPEVETGLMPGMTVKVAFVIGDTKQLRVPASAVFRQGEIASVYVVDADQHLLARQLRLGRQEGDRYEVLAGLSAGERIAVDPIAALAIVAGTPEARR